MSELDVGYAPARWAFDDEVTRVFDNMLGRSIPQYETMRRACYELGRRFVLPETAVVDVGCSLGEALAPFVADAIEGVTYFGLEVSEPMIDAARRRYDGNPDVSILAHDLRAPLPSFEASLVLSVLTLQFVPIDYRQEVLAGIYRGLVPGGAVILVEKVLGEGAALDLAFRDLYRTKKIESGYDPEDVERKRLALEGVLVPVTSKWNVELLRGAGFQEIDCFWRWMNFAGWIATAKE